MISRAKEYYNKIVNDIIQSPIKTTLIEPEDSKQNPHIFFCGFIAGLASRSLTAPLDRIKLIYQAQLNNKPKSIIDCAKEIERIEGWKGFYKYGKI